MIVIKSPATDLRNRIEVYAKKEVVTEYGVTQYRYEYLKTVWGSIRPVTNYAKKEEKLQGEVIRTNTTHRITFRMNALKEPTNDMYFIFKGQKYEIQYFNPSYKNNDIVEYFCKLIIETEEEHGYE